MQNPFQKKNNRFVVDVGFIGKVITVILLLFIGAFAESKYLILDRYFQINPSSPQTGATQLSKLVNTNSPKEKEDVDFDIFWEVWNLLERDYVYPEKLDATKMVDGAVGGLAASLEDPYTMYLPKEANERSAQDLAGAFYGVGIELGYIDGILAAVSPLEGTPAFAAGVKAGDLIINVKDEAKGIDEDSTRWPLNKAVDAIRGPKNSPVILTLLREGVEAPFEVTIKRGEIIVESVTLEFTESAGKRVAHLKVSRFGERTDAEWNTAVAEIVKQKNSINGIVLDMRNNPGGFFEGAINISSEFIDAGTVVTQKDRLFEQDFEARGKARLAGIPVEVLVNKGSASASEIVAGALRDRLGAQLIGTKTFGKGTVQDRRELSNGAGIHITVARWMLPGGDWIHDEGIPVNVEVEDNPETEADEQLLKAIEII
ncbi:MAG: peptidase S41 [Patescibacteria group bacterium]|nr:MAG: peptidase S41 [Patescibacteria group bacterium]